MSASAGSSPPSAPEDSSLLMPQGSSSDMKASRKRGREVSLEPSSATDAAAPGDGGAGRGRGSRPKKNKTGSQSTSEEDSPPRKHDDGHLMATDSPLGPKVTQIRRRVKDMTWKEGDEPSSSDAVEHMDAEDTAPVPEQMDDVQSSSPPPADDAPESVQLDETPASAPAAPIPEAQLDEEISADEPVLSPLPPTPPESSSDPLVIPGTPPVSTAIATAAADDDTAAASPAAERPVTSPAPATPPKANSDTVPPFDAEVDSVAPLPGTTEGAIPRPGATDKTLKRKSRDSVFFASGDVTEDDPYKKAKDDPKAKVTKADGEARPVVPATPPRAKSPNRFNGFASYSNTTSPFLKGAGTRSFLDEPAASPKPSFSAFGQTSSLFAKFSSPKPSSPAPAPASPAPSPAFASSGFSAFSSKPSPFLSGSPAGSPSAFGSPGPSTSSAFGARGSVPKSSEAFGAFSNTTTRFGGFGAASPNAAAAAAAAKKRAKSPKAAAKSKGGSEEEEDEDEDAEEGSNVSSAAPPAKTFDDILAGGGGGGKDDEDDEAKKKVDLEEVDLHTGEEHEKTLQQVRAKLYTMDSQNTYKEKGTGMLKVNVRKSDGKGARLVMRADGVLRLLMNASLFAGMVCDIGQDPKFIKISTFEEGAFVHHAIKVGNPKSAQALVELIHENLPEATSSTPKKPLTAEEAV